MRFESRRIVHFLPSLTGSLALKRSIVVVAFSILPTRSGVLRIDIEELFGAVVDFYFTLNGEFESSNYFFIIYS